jgi:hypothetical protein
MKTHLNGDLTSSLLAPSLRARFADLFGVAARKSVFAWHEASLPDAQVVIVDQTSNLQILPVLPPCVIWVGREQPSRANPGTWVGRLAQDYTLADLIDMLDRAAVFLLDWKARQSASAAVRASQPAPQVASSARSTWLQAESGNSALPSISPVSAANECRYRLQTWVFLSSPFDDPDCVAALALLARQPVTMQQLQTHTGLAPVLVVDLLQELARRRVLQVSPPASAMAAKAAAPKGAPVRKGFLQRLSKWIHGESDT